MTGVLEGYRVLEFGDYIAPQVLGMLLADQGAEVVKLEPPAGGRLRGAAPFAVWNRSKKSVILDASADATAGTINDLAASADILVADSETLPNGISVTELQAANPRLITVCLPAFAADHPNADLPPHETIVAAATGIYADRGTGAPSFHRSPSRQYLRRAHRGPRRRRGSAAPRSHRQRPAHRPCPSTTPCSALWAHRLSCCPRARTTPSPTRL